MFGTEPQHARRTDPPVPVDRCSDSELRARVRRSGAEDALVELYRRHHPAVLSYARTFTRDPHTTEDLASQAFTRTLHAVHSGAGPDAAWRPYLLTVVRHTAGQWAVTARRTELSEDFEQWLDARTAADPASGGAEYVDTEEHLPERWQAALWHSVVEGEPVERIGVLLGVSPSGVTSLTARAREGLRQAYLGAHAESSSRNEECRRHGPLLAAAVRRPGSSRVSQHLRRHLDGCESCRHALAELTDLDRRLGAVLPARLLLWGGHTFLTAQSGASAGGPGPEFRSLADTPGSGDHPAHRAAPFRPVTATTTVSAVPARTGRTMTAHRRPGTSGSARGASQHLAAARIETPMHASSTTSGRAARCDEARSAGRSSGEGTPGLAACRSASQVDPARMSPCRVYWTRRRGPVVGCVSRGHGERGAAGRKPQATAATGTPRRGRACVSACRPFWSRSVEAGGARPPVAGSGNNSGGDAVAVHRPAGRSASPPRDSGPSSPRRSRGRTRTRPTPTAGPTVVVVRARSDSARADSGFAGREG
ncbi:RNA polymerase sigma factor [Streptomyces sp. HMX112]|uniref:RNA polymerase sigma factor n=1 Tax=Streptomyces sp. HMX112 TaxID=3390850 RepID=UPI003A806DF1